MATAFEDHGLIASRVQDGDQSPDALSAHRRRTRRRSRTSGRSVNTISLLGSTKPECHSTGDIGIDAHRSQPLTRRADALLSTCWAISRGAGPLRRTAASWIIATARRGDAVGTRLEMIAPSAISLHRRNACTPMAAVRIGTFPRRGVKSSRTPSAQNALPVFFT